MKLWLWIILAILIYIYVSYYYKYPKDVSILQSGSGTFKAHLLTEKQPIVIDDTIKDIQEIKKAWFRWNYTNIYQEFIPEQWYKNKYKYLIIYPLEDTEVFLYSPSLPFKENLPDPEETVVVIKLKAQQLLIIPFHWYHMYPSQKQTVFMGVHDLITPFLS